MMFGIDASGAQFVTSAGVMLGMFAATIIGLLVFNFFYLEETRYFKEDHVSLNVVDRVLNQY